MTVAVVLCRQAATSKEVAIIGHVHAALRHAVIPAGQPVMTDRQSALVIHDVKAHETTVHVIYQAATTKPVAVDGAMSDVVVIDHRCYIGLEIILGIAHRHHEIGHDRHGATTIARRYTLRAVGVTTHQGKQHHSQ